MRKKLFLILLVITCSTLVMVSCQSDEAELGSKSKIEMLKAKSKELAKKYGVDVTLNEDSIVKYANLMTVESMEADYKAFAEMKWTTAKECSSVANEKSALKKKSFITRRKSETETTPTKPLTNKGDSFDYDAVSKTKCSNQICKDDGYVKIYGHFEWTYNASRKDITCIAYLRPACENTRCLSTGCRGCSPTLSERVALQVTGYNLNNHVTFTAIGTACLKLCMYNVNIGVRVYVDEPRTEVSYI